MNHRTQPFLVAIIGGGVTGRLLSAQLLRMKTKQPVSVLLLDRQPVEAEAPPKPAASKKPVNNEEEQRKLYADYCTFVLDRALEDRAPNVNFVRINSEVMSIIAEESETSGEIHLRNGKVIIADKIVLATGSLSRMKNGEGNNCDFRKVYDVLIADMRNRLLISPERSRFAVATSASGAVVDATGKISRLIYAAGSVRYAAAWRAMSIKGMYEEMRGLAQELNPVEPTQAQVEFGIPQNADVVSNPAPPWIPTL